MASPQLEQGFIRLAHELDAALSVAGFGREESLLLREVRSQCYGKSNRTEAVFNLTELERETGIPRQSFSRAMKRLLDGGVLVKTDTGYRFIKDYESWTRGGSPMFTPKLVAFCQSATRRSLGSTSKWRSASASPPEAPALHPDAQTEAPALQTSEAPALRKPKRQRFTPPSSPHRNARAEFENRETLHTHEKRAHADTPTPTDAVQLNADPVGEFRKRIEAWVLEHYGSGEELNAWSIGRYVADQLKAGHSEHAVLAALGKARERNVKVTGLARWIETFLANAPRIVVPPAPIPGAPVVAVAPTQSRAELRRLELVETLRKRFGPGIPPEGTSG